MFRYLIFFNSHSLVTRPIFSARFNIAFHLTFGLESLRTFYVFPTSWMHQPGGEDIGLGCCGGGVITTWAAGVGVIAAGSAV